MTHRIALVGCGSMGLNHARVIATSPRTSLSVIIDPHEEIGRAAAEMYGAAWAPELDGLGDVDAAVIAAPTEYHHGLAREVIRVGLPLLVEKPICPSVEETREIIAASEDAGTPLMCGLLERFNPAVRVALGMVEEALHVRSERHSPYAPRIRTGVAWDLLVHDVDLVVQAFGGGHPDAVEVAVGEFHPSSLPGAEDVMEAVMRFGSGIATVSASRIGQRKSRTMVIWELDKMIEVDLLRRGVTVYRHASVEETEVGHFGFRQRTEMEVPEIMGAEPLVSQLDHFVDLIEGTADVDRERDSILPAHQVVESALAARVG
ncbi:gfo/Idh/MocA family oxidoreductase [Nocardioides gansuensis]|uniref:Gfo/Idh/MocA family oxidoreductase n=1 Tax=Nocardioides gansuensis TaxID=2138300 RepID=A0A2T8F6L8_9ACTN|nr:Gfo/Idh/MocA family oxidoreductase [Nocardioides gansuensis]PVG81362.1 gfo/Idh/MocA family oxidoreductase [Nocardioides gansuensis]